MIRTEISTIIHRPPQQVFDYLAEFDNLPAYDPYVISVSRTSAGPVGVGSTWTHTRTQGRQQIVAPIKMVEFDSPRRFVMESGAGGFEVRSTMTFQPHGANATRVVEVLEITTKGVTRLLEPIIRRQVPKQSAEVHERLRQVVEGLPTPPATR